MNNSNTFDIEVRVPLKALNKTVMNSPVHSKNLAYGDQKIATHNTVFQPPITTKTHQSTFFKQRDKRDSLDAPPYPKVASKAPQ